MPTLGDELLQVTPLEVALAREAHALACEDALDFLLELDTNLQHLVEESRVLVEPSA